ncbi:hypothetical protein N9140_00940 [bacterium]|nr:hypothetical protein [bacterium]
MEPRGRRGLRVMRRKVQINLYRGRYPSNKVGGSNSAATVLHTNSDMYLTDLHTPSELNAPANTLCNAPHSDMYLTDLHTPVGWDTGGM